jgi:hypothetical protein
VRLKDKVEALGRAALLSMITRCKVVFDRLMKWKQGGNCAQGAVSTLKNAAQRSMFQSLQES